MPSPDDRAAQRRAGRDAVRAARTTRVRPLPWPLPTLGRWGRALGRQLIDVGGELVLGLLGLAVLAAVTAGARLAWDRAPAVTTAVAGLAGLYLVSAVVAGVHGAHSGRRTRQGRAAVAVLVLLGVLAGLALDLL